jgi:hypothetical protein
MILLLEREKETRKIDWHSRAHLARDLAAVAISENAKK